MAAFGSSILRTVDAFLEWIGTSLGIDVHSYCELETAEDQYTLVAKDASLVSVIEMSGINFLVGEEEFQSLLTALMHSLGSTFGPPGHHMQVMFNYQKDGIKQDLQETIDPAVATAHRLNLNLDDLFKERVEYLSNFCAKERIYFVIWTTPHVLSKGQKEEEKKSHLKHVKQMQMPPIQYGQNFLHSFSSINDQHHSIVRGFIDDLRIAGFDVSLLKVHKALNAVRQTVDPDVTNSNWEPSLPGDPVPIRNNNKDSLDISDLVWPRLSSQLIPRDGECIDLRIARIGDKIYAPVYIELFPKEVQLFNRLYARCHASQIPWRVSFDIDSDGFNGLSLKSSMASMLTFAGRNNRLISDSVKSLRWYEDRSDDSVVMVRAMFCTWAQVGEESLLRTRAAELTKAIQSWGHTEVSEVSGDSYGATLSSALALSRSNFATPTTAPLSKILTMLPITRPSSPWQDGAVLFRSPDGKPWPYQPGSSKQTTWIDLIYARPGSGKSVLSNMLNLAVCLSAGLKRLPRISIIDIGPSSSGLISLLQEALPKDQKDLVAYHRLRMTPEYSINPFDTQLGSRYPTPLERSFLVNFLTLLATPLGAQKSYDGITDLAGMVVDLLYKDKSDLHNPNRYNTAIEHEIDTALLDLKMDIDDHTSWWEVTDFLFAAGHIDLAIKAQRYAMPLASEAASMVRSSSVVDLFGEMIVETNETIIKAFNRMISSAIREYPILGRPTFFDLGRARVVSLDLDEVARTGGDAANRQTAVMYMVARYVLAKDFYLTMENLGDISSVYREYHRARIIEIREDPKRIVMDEFHRTSHAAAVRNQVIVDMREGRKWKVQVALLSQSLEDFDKIMIDFATSIYIMDAGPEQAIEQTRKTFGLSPTATSALRTYVHGPRSEGATFLALFSTKMGTHTQLVTSSIGPIELWAFSTTADDARIRNELYDRVGPSEARRLLAKFFPSGTAAPLIERRLASMRSIGALDENSQKSIVDELIDEILDEYKRQLI